jgi:hypothetical protein
MASQMPGPPIDLASGRTSVLRRNKHRLARSPSIKRNPEFEGAVASLPAKKGIGKKPAKETVAKKKAIKTPSSPAAITEAAKVVGQILGAVVGAAKGALTVATEVGSAAGTAQRSRLKVSRAGLVASDLRVTRNV